MVLNISSKLRLIQARFGNTRSAPASVNLWMFSSGAIRRSVGRPTGRADSTYGIFNRT